MLCFAGEKFAVLMDTVKKLLPSKERLVGIKSSSETWSDIYLDPLDWESLLKNADAGLEWTEEKDATFIYQRFDYSQIWIDVFVHEVVDNWRGK